MEYGRLSCKIKLLEDYNDVVDKRITAIEKEVTLLAQYGRRESKEILGLPSSVKINELEMVIEILNNIGVNVSEINIVAVQRLKGMKLLAQ